MASAFFSGNFQSDLRDLRRLQSKISRNGKVMLSIIVLTLVPYSLLLLADHYVQYPRLMDFITRVLLLGTEKRGSPERTKLLKEIKEDARNIAAIQLIFTIGFCFISLFSMTATIYASAMTTARKKIIFKDLISMIKRTWTQPVMTMFYVFLLGSGYALLVLASLVVVVVVSDGFLVLIVSCILTALLESLLFLDLAASWGLGLVISVVEEGLYGLEALGKAAEIIKGKVLHFQGFTINLVFSMICGTILGVLGYKFVTSLVVAKRLVILLVIVNMLCLVNIFYFIAYTMFYLHCKKTH